MHEALTAARVSFIRLLAAVHADGMRMIDLILNSCEDEAEPPPRRKKARRTRKGPEQPGLF